MKRLELTVLPGRYAVCRLEAAAPRPAWADDATSAFASVTRTADELSIVCDERVVPDGTPAQRGWRCLAVAGPLAFEEVGILAGLSGALADAGVSLFAVSTFDTDYLLIREPDVAAAVGALETAGHDVTYHDGGRSPR
ncbi:MAG: ACT domain-containing protein [Planctomycetota bacterium]|jgi:hypothetical protein